MGTSKYLDSVLRILPGVQARQITELLRGLQVSGQVRNATEYEAKLRELASLVNSSSPVPSFQQLRALVWSMCSSDAHNTMMQALKNDIEAAFLQVDEIGQKIADHNVLFMGNTLLDLDRNLSEQENKIRSLEWLADQTNEFTRVLVNTFSSASLLSVARSEVGADNLYYDNRTTEQARKNTYMPSAFVSVEGRKLILDSETDPTVKPIEIVVHTDSNSYGTEIQVDTESDINNIIDGTVGTFWNRNIYLYTEVPKVSTILEFVFGSGRDVNYLIVQGGSTEPFFVERIDGVHPDGYVINLLSEEIEIDTSKRIDFPRSFVKSIRVTFYTKTSHRAEYFVPKDNSVHDVFDSKNKYERLLKRDWMGPVVRKAIASERAANICNVPNPPTKQINSFRYTLTLDNVWFGNSSYIDSGVFVSKPLKIDNIGILAIRTTETEEPDAIATNSIEYEIIKIDTSPKYKQTSFSIPKIGQTTVGSERLVLSKKQNSLSPINDIGILRFCPYIASTWTSPPYPILVYKNGVQMAPGSDYVMSIDEGANWHSSYNSFLYFPDYKTTPPKFWIKINSPELNVVYTVDYTIRTSDSKETTESSSQTLWLDIDKTISLHADGRVQFRQENSDTIVSSDIYLQVTLRRNVSSSSSSPELIEYAVLASSYE
jgi:hypothetical protein